MKISKKTKEDQLKMPIGTARNILVKKMLFDMAEKLSLLFCYRCGEKIENVSDFVLDHKTDWLHSDKPVELYFDTNNIAFSHAICNGKAARYKSIVKSKSGFKGVVLKQGRYQVYIGTKNKIRYLGSFSTAQEAATVYDIESEKLHGEKAVTNKKLGLLGKNESSIREPQEWKKL